MKRVLIILWVLLGAGLLMVNSASAVTTYYSNQSAWNSAVSGITTETYESYAWNYSGGDHLYNNPGVALGGITYSFPGYIFGINSTVKINDAPYLSGKYLFWQYSPNLMTITLPNPVYAIAFNYGEYWGGLLDLSVSLGNGDSATVGTLLNSYAFFGAVSDTPFTSFSLNASRDFILIDNLSQASPVPIPGALVLFGSGIIGLIGIKRRMRK